MRRYRPREIKSKWVKILREFNSVKCHYHTLINLLRQEIYNYLFILFITWCVNSPLGIQPPASHASCFLTSGWPLCLQLTSSAQPQPQLIRKARVKTTEERTELEQKSPPACQTCDRVKFWHFFMNQQL